MNYKDTNIYFIRHAQSTFNQGMTQFQLENDGYKDMNFDQLSVHKKFRDDVRYHHKHLDSSITENGKKQCQKALKYFEDNQITPDLILVSPLNRTLETCMQVFGKLQGIPIFVEPLIGEILKSSCDLSHPLETKKSKFQYFNFSECETLGDHWYIKKNSVSYQQNFRYILQNSERFCYEQSIKTILQKMDQNDLVETQEDLYQRCYRAIKKIQENYAMKYKKIVVVTHFMFMNCISAMNYDHLKTPLDGICVSNCGVYETNLHDLIQKGNR